MRRYFRLALLACVALLTAGAVVALATSPSSTLSERKTKALLRQLPYRFDFHPVQTPPDASGAVAGTATGPHHTVVRFGVSLGKRGKPVPIGGSLSDATGGDGFRVSNDVLVRDADHRIAVNPRYGAPGQWNMAAHIVSEIEQRLCRATTGAPCEV